MHRSMNIKWERLFGVSNANNKQMGGTFRRMCKRSNQKCIFFKFTYQLPTTSSLYMNSGDYFQLRWAIRQNTCSWSACCVWLIIEYTLHLWFHTPTGCPTLGLSQFVHTHIYIHTHSLAFKTQDSKHCSYDGMSIHNVHCPCQYNRTIPLQQWQHCEIQHSQSSVTENWSLLVRSTFPEMKATPSFSTSEQHA
jgi:hypothetical protein